MYTYSRKLGKESNLPLLFAVIRRCSPLFAAIIAAICRYHCRHSPLFAVIIVAVRRYLPLSLPLFAVICRYHCRYLPLSLPLFAVIICRYSPLLFAVIIQCYHLLLLAAICCYLPLSWSDSGSPGWQSKLSRQGYWCLCRLYARTMKAPMDDDFLHI